MEQEIKGMRNVTKYIYMRKQKTERKKRNHRNIVGGLAEFKHSAIKSYR